MEQIKVIFIGTSDIGKSLLKAINEHPKLELSGVLTGPDKRFGRKMILQSSAIKLTAQELNIEILQPDDINSPESYAALRNFEADMFVVMAYGQILSGEVLAIPKIDCVNVHASLLPKYRGASPIVSTILSGDSMTGVCLMKMVEDMDAGPVYECFQQTIDPRETADELTQKLAENAAINVPDSLVRIAKGMKSAEQNEAEACYVTKISKEDGNLNWMDDIELIDAKVRAFSPWPSTYTFFAGKRLKILKAHGHRLMTGAEPGTVVEADGMIGIATKNGFLEPKEVQIEGRNAQSPASFLNGNIHFMGSKLTSSCSSEV